MLSFQESDNKVKFKMALLYAQTEELKKFYQEDMEVSPKNYYLVDKDWLDNYKNKNNYKEECEKYKNFKDWEDYNDFKNKIKSSYSLDDNDFRNDMLENTNQIESKKQKLAKYDSSYVEKGELINQEYFELFINRNNELKPRDVRIGNKTILITDEDNDNYAYSYSLVEEPNKNNFYIKVDNILMFKDSNTLYDQASEIITFQGINNYLLNRKIDILKKEAQYIMDNRKNIGTFLNLKIENNQNNNMFFNENPGYLSSQNQNNYQMFTNENPGYLSNPINNNNNSIQNQNNNLMFTNENPGYLSNPINNNNEQKQNNNPMFTNENPG